MRKILLISTMSLFAVLLMSAILLGLILFVRPTLILNPATINWVLTETQVVKHWSWGRAEINHEWKSWSHRRFSGRFENLCFEFGREALNVKSCLDLIAWDLDLVFDSKGFKSNSNGPVIVNGRFSRTYLRPVPEKIEEEPFIPDLWSYWQTFWSPAIPDLKIFLPKNVIKKEDSEYRFDVIADKTKDDFIAEVMRFKLHATPEYLEFFLPPKYALPKKEGMPQMHLLQTHLKARVTEKKIPVEIQGLLEAIHFDIKSRIDLPLKSSLDSLDFRKKALLNTHGKATVSDIKKQMKGLTPQAFQDLPAPINSMNGTIDLDVTTEKTKVRENVLIKFVADADLKSRDQALEMDVNGDFIFDLLLFTPQQLRVGIDFRKVILKLPKIEKKELPPQFLPDSRIQNTGLSFLKKKEKKESSFPMSFNIEALNEKSLVLNSNLLDEPLRLNMDLKVVDDKMSGYVRSLPIKTKVFKRPIKVPSMQVNFNSPAVPVLKGSVVFLLPEYKITMKLEGPIKEPRYSFESEPPLQRNDIYSVLLFGRPMSDLDPDDKQSAARTNEILAQGVLSLSVLYFLAGSPVEYIGYDPDSKQAQAQIGLGKKSSLRVGGDSGGINTTGVRHSLGNGWFIDTSATAPERSSATSSTSSSTDYGVLLERIISY